MSALVLAALVAQLWEAEGETLRALVESSDGERRGEAWLRLGDWEREAAFRVEQAGQGGSEAHLDAAEAALVQAVPLVDRARLGVALYALGDLRRTRGNAEGARAPLLRLVTEAPDEPLAVDAAVALGDDAFDAGALAEAVDRYTFARTHAATPGPRAYAQYKLAWCRLNLQELAEARSLLEEVVTLAAQSGLSLAQEARRDLVRVLARDTSVTAAGARETIERLVPAASVRRFEESYARLVSASGRDDVAREVLDAIAPGADTADAVRISTLAVEIAVRHRDLSAVGVSASRLGAVLAAFPQLADGEEGDAAERALRVGAISLHGEGRANGQRPVLEGALALYDAWFLAFDTRPTAYELHHHAGELLLSIGRFAEAERHSTRAVLLDEARVQVGQPPGKWLESAAANAVAAADRVVGEPIALAADRVDPEPLTPPERLLVEACERSLRLLPDGPEAVHVAYRRALVLYRRRHFDAARVAFEALAKAHAADPIAGHAAQLALDALRRTGRFDELAALAEALARIPAHLARARATLLEVRESAVLAAAARAADEGRADEAARRYDAFVRTFPSSASVDRALFNEAAAHEASGREQVAVEVRARLLERFASSPLAPRARRRQLGALVCLGRFAAAWPLALQVAEESTGTDRARALRVTYVTNHPREPEAMSHALALADAARGCEAGRSALDRALQVAPDTAWRVRVLARRARLEERCGGPAIALAARIVGLDARSPLTRDDARDAAADAALILATEKVERFRKERLGEPWDRTLTRKFELLKAADDALAAVIARGRAVPAVCALVEAGQAYADLSKALAGARPPRSFTQAQREIFAEALETRAQPLVDRAREALGRAITTAGTAGVEPACLARARTTLAVLSPERFAPPLELLAPLTLPPEPADAGALEVLEHHPDAPAAWLLAARAHLASGRPLAALVLLDRLQGEDASTPVALELRARALGLSGRVEAAEATWRKLAALGSDVARRRLADRALTAGDLERARDLLEALSTDPPALDVLQDLGVVRRRLGDTAGAEGAMRQLLSVAPDRAAARLNLGLLLCADGRANEGAPLLADALKLLDSLEKRPGLAGAIAACRALVGRAP